MSVDRALKDPAHPFTQVSKSFIYDCRLSLKSKALLIFVLSKPDTWVFNYRDVLRFNSDGIRSVRNSIKELSSLGYLIVRQDHRPNGDFDYSNYLFCEIPLYLNTAKTATPAHSPFAHTRNAHTRNAHTRNSNTPNKKDKITLKDKITTTAVVNTSTIPDDEALISHNKKSKCIRLLKELKVTNLKKIFDLFSLSDILSTAEWIIDNNCYMIKPTGFFIKAVRENYKDCTISDSEFTDDPEFFYKCKKCNIVHRYLNEIDNFDFCNKCGGIFK